MLNNFEYPYEIELDIYLGSNAIFEIDEDIILDFSDDLVLRIHKQDTSPREQQLGISRLRLSLLAFSDATKAEVSGKQLVFAILWLAASHSVSIQFQKFVGEFPFTIRDRNQSRGSEMRGEGRVSRNIEREKFREICKEAFESRRDIPNEMLISMEIFASAKFESSERAKFVAMVTALEAICKQREYGNEVEVFIKAAKALPEFASLFDQEQSIKDSFASRISNFKRESVRQSIHRKLRECGVEKEEIKQVDEAYGIRSQILHEGLLERRLLERTEFIEKIVRRVYSNILGHNLAV